MPDYLWGCRGVAIYMRVLTDAKPMMRVSAVEPMVEILRASGVDSRLMVDNLTTAIWAAHIWLAIMFPSVPPTFDQNPELMMAAFLFFLMDQMDQMDKGESGRERKVALSWLHQFLGRRMQYGVINAPVHYPQAHDEESLSSEVVEKRRQNAELLVKVVKPFTSYENQTPDEDVSEGLKAILAENPGVSVTSFELVDSDFLEKIAVVSFVKEGQTYFHLILQYAQMIVTVKESDVASALKDIKAIILDVREQMEAIRINRNRMLDIVQISGVGCISVGCMKPAVEHLVYDHISQEGLVVSGVMLAVVLVLLDVASGMRP